MSDDIKLLVWVIILTVLCFIFGMFDMYALVQFGLVHITVLS